MKNVFLLILCLITIMLCFGVEEHSRIDEIEKQTEIKLFEMQKTIAAQEKEIRLLKTDLEILENGF